MFTLQDLDTKSPSPTLTGFIVHPKLCENNLLNGTVADLIDNNTKSWKYDLIRKLYHQPIVKEIMNVLVSKTKENTDKILWKHSNKGEYSVSKVYSIIHQHQNTTRSNQYSYGISPAVWKPLWKVKLLMKIITCVWKILHDSLPAFENLVRRGISTHNRCLMCDEEKYPTFSYTVLLQELYGMAPYLISEHQT
ncbi:hypothetical protein SO802_003056 [Lithocarpus litseifolius]|uniref:Reverse transcriptase zinc-binding domain-containing protein n=1 Tax=Lithocarpus litseifolius TaxID=425828 RepID=A0AAW2DZJ9_9ROSI